MVNVPTANRPTTGLTQPKKAKEIILESRRRAKQGEDFYKTLRQVSEREIEVAKQLELNKRLTARNKRTTTTTPKIEQPTKVTTTVTQSTPTPSKDFFQYTTQTPKQKQTFAASLKDYSVQQGSKFTEQIRLRQSTPQHQIKVFNQAVGRHATETLLAKQDNKKRIREYSDLVGQNAKETLQARKELNLYSKDVGSEATKDIQQRQLSNTQFIIGRGQKKLSEVQFKPLDFNKPADVAIKEFLSPVKDIRQIGLGKGFEALNYLGNIEKKVNRFSVKDVTSKIDSFNKKLNDKGFQINLLEKINTKLKPYNPVKLNPTNYVVRGIDSLSKTIDKNKLSLTKQQRTTPYKSLLGEPSAIDLKQAGYSFGKTILQTGKMGITPFTTTKEIGTTVVSLGSSKGGTPLGFVAGLGSTIVKDPYGFAGEAYADYLTGQLLTKIGGKKKTLKQIEREAKDLAQGISSKISLSKQGSKTLKTQGRIKTTLKSLTSKRDELKTLKQQQKVFDDLNIKNLLRTNTQSKINKLDTKRIPKLLDDLKRLQDKEKRLIQKNVGKGFETITTTTDNSKTIIKGLGKDVNIRVLDPTGKPIPKYDLKGSINIGGTDKELKSVFDFRGKTGNVKGSAVESISGAEGQGSTYLTFNRYYLPEKKGYGQLVKSINQQYVYKRKVKTLNKYDSLFKEIDIDRKFSKFAKTQDTKTISLRNLRKGEQGLIIKPSITKGKISVQGILTEQNKGGKNIQRIFSKSQGELFGAELGTKTKKVNPLKIDVDELIKSAKVQKPRGFAGEKLSKPSPLTELGRKAKFEAEQTKALIHVSEHNKKVFDINKRISKMQDSLKTAKGGKLDNLNNLYEGLLGRKEKLLKKSVGKGSITRLEIVDGKIKSVKGFASDIKLEILGSKGKPIPKYDMRGTLVSKGKDNVVESFLKLKGKTGKSGTHVVQSLLDKDSYGDVYSKFDRYQPSITKGGKPSVQTRKSTYKFKESSSKLLEDTKVLLETNIPPSKLSKFTEVHEAKIDFFKPQHELKSVKVFNKKTGRFQTKIVAKSKPFGEPVISSKGLLKFKGTTLDKTTTNVLDDVLSSKQKISFSTEGGFKVKELSQPKFVSKIKGRKGVSPYKKFEREVFKPSKTITPMRDGLVKFVPPPLNVKNIKSVIPKSVGKSSQVSKTPKVSLDFKQAKGFDFVKGGSYKSQGNIITRSSIGSYAPLQLKETPSVKNLIGKIGIGESATLESAKGIVLKQAKSDIYKSTLKNLQVKQLKQVKGFTASKVGLGEGHAQSVLGNIGQSVVDQARSEFVTSQVAKGVSQLKTKYSAKLIPQSIVSNLQRSKVDSTLKLKTSSVPSLKSRLDLGSRTRLEIKSVGDINNLITTQPTTLVSGGTLFGGRVDTIATTKQTTTKGILKPTPTMVIKPIMPVLTFPMKFTNVIPPFIPPPPVPPINNRFKFIFPPLNIVGRTPRKTSKPKKKKLKVPTKYAPSITGLKLKGKIPKFLTGVEVRAIKTKR